MELERLRELESRWRLIGCAACVLGIVLLLLPVSLAGMASVIVWSYVLAVALSLFTAIVAFFMMEKFKKQIHEMENGSPGIAIDKSNENG